MSGFLTMVAYVLLFVVFWMVAHPRLSLIADERIRRYWTGVFSVAAIVVIILIDQLVGIAYEAIEMPDMTLTNVSFIVLYSILAISFFKSLFAKKIRG